MIERRKTKVIQVGNVAIGGNNPISIQSMTTTKTADVIATAQQIKLLTIAGCDIVRVAVPDIASAEAIKQLKQLVSIPIIADIHFDHKLAIASIKAGVDGLRLNPGNIGSEQNVLKVVEVARERKIPIRIGVNSGSLSKEKLQKYGAMYVGEGIRYGDLKNELAEAIYVELEPIQKRRVELEKNPDYVKQVIEEGAKKARVIASATLAEVKEKMGLI